MERNERTIRSLSEVRARRKPGEDLLLRRAMMSATPQSIRWHTERYNENTEQGSNAPDLVCFSHLRWEGMEGRPHQMMKRSARDRRVFFVEPPLFSTGSSIWLDLSQLDNEVWVVVPYMPEGMSRAEVSAAQEKLLAEMFNELRVNDYTLWYYTPEAIEFTRGLRPLATVYDCVGELQEIGDDLATLRELEQELLHRADIVFTSGKCLFNRKCGEHQNIHYLPDGIDIEHFAQARALTICPEDLAHIPHPRIGYCGPIDERIDLNLLAILAESRPDWHFVLIGSMENADRMKIPMYPNVHYLGPKSYEELPAYMAGWNAAMLPFARNEVTRYVNPGTVAQYLAAGKPVVSTSVWDIVRIYGEEKLVSIADTLAEFIIAAAEAGMDETRDLGSWQSRVDAFLEQASWDRTWMRATELLEETTGIRCYSASRSDTTYVQVQARGI